MTAELLERLGSTDWGIVREAVDAASATLRAQHGDDLRSTLAERFLDLTGHDKWEIRKSVAQAALHLRHDAFHAVIARLVEDENAWVREAARRSLRRRSELTRADLHGDGNGEALSGLLAGLEARHGRRARQAALRVADRLHHRFVREAYHEIIRVIAPLDASLLNLETGMTAAGLPPGMLAQVQRARARARMIAEFLDNLRALTADGEASFTHEPLAPLIREALELTAAAEELAVQGIDFAHEVEQDLCIEIDRSRLLQALINLLVNAVEACAETGRRGRVLVTARRQAAGRVSITVSDNGKGMSAEALRDCAQLYSSGKPGGMGFGLPLARKIIEVVHRGTLCIASREGEGTTATLVLPAEQAGRDE
jgi:signal transduction histidine kinase